MLDVLIRTDEDRLLAEMAARVFASSTDAAARLAEAGLLAVPLRESQGGIRPDEGGDASALAIAFAAKGAAFAVEDALLRTVLGGTLLAASSPDMADRIVSGSVRPALALHEAGSRTGIGQCATTASPTFDGWTLSGGKTMVLGARDATHFLIVAETGQGRAIFLVDASAVGLTIRNYCLRDGSSAADIELRDCVLSGAALAIAPDVAMAALDGAIALARIALVAEAAGLIHAALARTVSYADQREQFGKAIGAFQVVQHRMADIAIAADQAAAMAASVATTPSDVGGTARICRAVAELGLSVFKACIQLHGGYGMTEDLPFGLGLRRMMTIALLF